MAADSSQAPVPILAMATKDEKCDFKPMEFNRRPVGPHDVLFDVKYCGVCHTDLHAAANHMSSFKQTSYPCVPGHEVSGVCVEVGSEVNIIGVGDHVALGCIVDSCFSCAACKQGDEQLCYRGNVGTYNSDSIKHGHADTYPVGGRTLGGYSNRMVVHERFAIKIPPSYPLEAAGPLLCSGLTMYEPMMKYALGKETRIGIVGMGGLGLMGIKIASALGYQEVVAVSRTEAKAELAKGHGATKFIATASTQKMSDAAGSLDLLLNTVPAYHDYSVYSSLLSKGGKQVLLGAHAGFAASLVTESIKKKFGCVPTITHSYIGGTRRSQELVDLCAKKNVVPFCKVVPVQELNQVFENLDKSNDDGVRYVLDIGNTLNEDTAGKCTSAPPNLQENPTRLSKGQVIKDSLWMMFRG